MRQETLLDLFIAAQDCIPAGNGNGLPNVENTERAVDRLRIPRHHQAIIPSYKFDCSDQMCGNITEWGVDVRRDGGNHQPGGNGRPYTLDFQVWRPSPTVNDSTGTGCYSLVGNNRFTSISLSDGVAESLSPSRYIQFQPGDVLGVYVEVARESDDGVVILTSHKGTNTFTSETVWYGSIEPSMTTSQNGDCPYSVGSNGVLDTSTRGAPIISIKTGKNSNSDTHIRFIIIIRIQSPTPALHYLQHSLPLHLILPLKMRRLLPRHLNNHRSQWTLKQLQ